MLFSWDIIFNISKMNTQSTICLSCNVYSFTIAYLHTISDCLVKVSFPSLKTGQTCRGAVLSRVEPDESSSPLRHHLHLLKQSRALLQQCIAFCSNLVIEPTSLLVTVQNKILCFTAWSLQNHTCGI
jgi:hypothetical protein